MQDSAAPAPPAAIDELTRLLLERMDEFSTGRVMAANFLRVCEQDELIGAIVRLTLKTPARYGVRSQSLSLRSCPSVCWPPRHSAELGLTVQRL